MRWWQKIFGKKEGKRLENNKEIATSFTEQVHNKEPGEQWREIPLFVEVEGSQRELAAVISSAICAGDAPDSTWQVKSIKQHNPDAKVISLIAASLAAEIYPESQWKIHSIKEKI